MTDKQPPDDRQLNDYLHGRSEESALYAQAEQLQVPAHLEFAVKRLAREAVQGPPTAGAGGPKPRLFWPYALVAGLLIALGVSGLLTLNFSSTAPDIPAEQIVQNQPDPGNAPVPPDPTTLPLDKAPLDQTVLQQLATEDTSHDTKKRDKSIAEVPRMVVLPPQPAKQKQQQAQNTPLQPVKPGNRVATNDVKKQEPIPAHLQELLQPASVHAPAATLPPQEILEQWSLAQWLEQIRALRQRGDRQNAQQYIEAFAKYYPQQDIEKLLAEQP